MKIGGLNPREAQFVQEYLIDKNAARAARAAGYAPSTAAARAAEWVGESRAQSRKPHVWDAVEAGLDRLAEQAGVSARRVLDELAAIAFADPAPYLDFDPDQPEAACDLRAVAEISHKHTAATATRPAVRETRLKLHSKLQALKLLGDHLGVFKTPEQAITAEFLIDLAPPHE